MNTPQEEERELLRMEMDDSSSSIISQELGKEELLLKSHIHITNHMYCFINCMSLKCALKLGIFDTIHNHSSPMSLSDLGLALALPHQKVQFLPHLMRILTHSGYLSISKPIPCDQNSYNYSLTPTALLLLRDHPFTIRPYVLSMLEPDLERPWHMLSEWFQSDQPENHTPFAFANNGKTLWEYAGQKPDFNSTFNEAMAGDSRLTASILLADNNSQFSKLGKPDGFFSGLSSLVDVGGGTGDLARAIALTYPNMKCTVLDLPHVVCGLKGTHNLSFVEGDMFKGVPPADAVVLKILKQCRKAITSEENQSGQLGKVIIIDIVMNEEPDEDYKFKETQLFYDTEMMVLITGKERTEKEWKKLFEDAGFNGGYKIYPVLGLRSLIEVYP